MQRKIRIRENDVQRLCKEMVLVIEMNASTPYVYYNRKPIYLLALHANYVIHRWRTLYGSHRSHFHCKSSHNRCRNRLYRHLIVGRNIHHQHISTTIQLVSNHQTSSDHRRIPRDMSELESDTVMGKAVIPRLPR